MSYYPYPVPTPAFRGPDKNAIKVTGEGTVTASPDQAFVTLGVISEGPNLTAVQAENAATINRVIDSLQQSGIQRQYIKTTDYRVEPQYDYVEGKQVFRAYRVTHLLQVRIDAVSQIGQAIDAAVAGGANFVSSIRFAIAAPEAYYNQALSLAVKDARSKAYAIAKALGVTLNQVPDQVEEIPPSAPPIPYRQVTALEKAAATPIEPGQLEITAQVRVEYSYL